ncbi:MAG: DUF192 domain-containing protein [Pseudomonadota bacterium]
MGNSPAERRFLKPAFAVLWLFILCIAMPGQGLSDEVCATDRIDFNTENGIVSFSIEVVDTPETRARGLMERTDLERDEGMLFVHETASQMSFWMKNTPLPLDIVFLNKRGVICSITARTTPYSLDHIPSGCASQTVLEVNAGVAEEQGLRVGTPGRHPAINQPVWACR